MTKISKASFGGLYGTSGATFPDNTTAEISEGDMRTFGNHIQDSVMFIDDHFIDEDSFTSDSATKAPSQQSVKAYVSAQIGGTALLSASVTVSSAQILTLFTSPVQIIAAPGAGNYIDIISASIFYDYATTAYGGGTTVYLQFNNGTEQQATDGSALLAQTADMIALLDGQNSIAVQWSVIENAPIQIKASPSNPTTGDSTLKVRILYRIVTI